MAEHWILFGVAALGGGIAAIAGFGIGSVLTPALSAFVPARIAVAAVSVPHFVATAFRLWRVRTHVDRVVLRSFGLMSAAGGLAGAVVGQFLNSRLLELVLAVLLLFVGLGGLIGFTKRMEFRGRAAWLAGGASGFLGGLVGNQGGIRAGAMLGLGVSRDAFVATSTATGLIVDAARMPAYVGWQWNDLLKLAPQIGSMIAGVMVGTAFGLIVLRRIPQTAFLKVVCALLVCLSAWLILKP